MRWPRPRTGPSVRLDPLRGPPEPQRRRKCVIVARVDGRHVHVALRTVTASDGWPVASTGRAAAARDETRLAPPARSESKNTCRSSSAPRKSRRTGRRRRGNRRRPRSSATAGHARPHRLGLGRCGATSAGDRLRAGQPAPRGRRQGRGGLVQKFREAPIAVELAPRQFRPASSWRNSATATPPRRRGSPPRPGSRRRVRDCRQTAAIRPADTGARDPPVRGGRRPRPPRSAVGEPAGTEQACRIHPAFGHSRSPVRSPARLTARRAR